MKTFTALALALSASTLIACGGGSSGQTTYDPPAPAETNTPAPAQSSPPASVTAVAPAFGVSGDTVTVMGVGFGDTAGTVSVGEVAGTVVSWSDTQVVATVPAGTGPGSKFVAVTAAGASSPFMAPTTFDVKPRVETVTMPDAATLYVNGDDYATAGTAPNTMPVELVDADGNVVRTMTGWFPTAGGFANVIAIPCPADLSGMNLSARVVSFGVRSNAVAIPSF